MGNKRVSVDLSTLQFPVIFFVVFFYSGKSYFRGPWFITPSEVPSGAVYKQELFLSTLEETNPIVSIVGRCAVLDYNDYISSKFRMSNIKNYSNMSLFNLNVISRSFD